MKYYFKKTNRDKGAALIITFFIMIIILSIDLFISAILYSEIKIIRNIGNSVAAFYAAESGIEKVIYYDKKVLPPSEEGPGNVRGLCFMCDSTNPDACDEEPIGYSGDRSIFCNDCAPVPGDAGFEGCDPYLCNNCEITFNTFLDDEKHYEIRAFVKPVDDGSEDVFSKVDSTGYYKNYVLRAIEINIQE